MPSIPRVDDAHERGSKGAISWRSCPQNLETIIVVFMIVVDQCHMAFMICEGGSGLDGAELLVDHAITIL